MYWGYGLTFRSEIPLPELVRVDPNQEPDVEITLGKVPAGSGEEGIVAQFQDLFRFLIATDRIVVEVLRDVDPDVLRTRLLGEIFATLLRQRGLLVLHACAVEGSEGAICFIGESGWGKSTLAEAFLRQGYALLTDDVAAIEISPQGNPLVIPSYPQVRLREDAADHFEPDGTGLSPIWRSGHKLARSEVKMSEAPVPLVAAYFLQPRYHPCTSVSDLPARDAVMQLVTHTRARTLIQTNTPWLLAQHLHQCTTFAQSVKAKTLNRRKSLKSLEEIVKTVELDSGNKHMNL